MLLQAVVPLSTRKATCTRERTAMTHGRMYGMMTSVATLPVSKSKSGLAKQSTTREQRNFVSGLEDVHVTNPQSRMCSVGPVGLNFREPEHQTGIVP